MLFINYLFIFSNISKKNINLLRISNIAILLKKPIKKNLTYELKKLDNSLPFKKPSIVSLLRTYNLNVYKIH